MRTPPAQIEVDLVSARIRAERSGPCECCGHPKEYGDYFCRICRDAITRLNARGVYYNYRPDEEWHVLISEEICAELDRVLAK